MATVKQLIDHLNGLDPNEPIIYQYFTSEHAGEDESRFADLVERLDDTDLYDELSRVISSYLSEVASE